MEFVIPTGVFVLVIAILRAFFAGNSKYSNRDNLEYFSFVVGTIICMVAFFYFLDQAIAFVLSLVSIPVMLILYFRFKRGRTKKGA